jgi:poly(3-hydroxybutyrate) depolymerase
LPCRKKSRPGALVALPARFNSFARVAAATAVATGAGVGAQGSRRHRCVEAAGTEERGDGVAHEARFLRGERDEAVGDLERRQRDLNSCRERRQKKKKKKRNKREKLAACRQGCL